MSTFLKRLLAASVVLLGACGTNLPTDGPARLPSATPPAIPEPSVATAEGLPELSFPGPRAGGPGEYGWTGRPGQGASMHWVTDGREAAVMRFLSPNREACFRSAPSVRVPVTIAGYDGAYLEPFLPPVIFNGVGDELTRAYELTIGSDLLCVYVTWHPTTTADELDAALGILDTLRAEYREDGSIRITFTLEHGWDTG